MTIKVKMGQGDIKKLTLRQLFAAQKGNMESMIAILSHFVYDEEDRKLPPDLGMEALLDLTLEDLELVMKSLQGAIQDGAVPPKNATSLNSQ